jgi:dipeptidase
MHAGWGPVRISQSVGSLVSHLTPERQTHWVTATAAPCTSLFKPVWMDAGLPDLGPSPTAQYNAATLWWRHEALHREVLRDYQTRLAVFREERDRLEREFLAGAAEVAGAPAEVRAAFSAQCFARADEALARWTAQVRATPPKGRLPFLYAQAWRAFNRKAQMPE